MKAQCCLCDFEMDNIDELDGHLDHAHAHLFAPETSTRARMQYSDANEEDSMDPNNIKIEYDDTTSNHSNYETDSLVDNSSADFGDKNSPEYSDSAASDEEDDSNMAEQYEMVVLPGYKCKECPFVTTDVKTLKEHLKQHTSTSSPNQAPKKTNLEQKIELQPSLDINDIAEPLGQSLNCNECGKIFSNRNNLRSHVKVVHLKIKNHVCQICNKAFFKPNNLRAHLKTHKPVKLNISISKDQNISSRGQNSRNSDASHATAETMKEAHVKLEELNQDIETCIRQASTPGIKKGQSFDTDTSLGLVENSLDCTHCGKSFANRKNLRSHVRNVHLNMKNHICNVCNKAFFKPTHLKRHEKSHLCVKAHNSLSFEDNISFTDQNYSISETSHQSEDNMDEPYIIKQEINLDIETAPIFSPGSSKFQSFDADADPLDTSLDCDYCGKSFANRKNLRSHIKLVHLNIRNHICNICNKAFFKPNNLIEHAKTHKSSNTDTSQVSVDDMDTTPLNQEEIHLSIEKSPKQAVKNTTLTPVGYTTLTPVGLKLESLETDFISAPVDESLTCSVCNKLFSSRSSLKTHVKMVHLQIKNHFCEFCNKAFFKPSLLRRHEETHKSAKSYIKILTDSYENISYRDSSASETCQSLPENMGTSPLIKEERNLETVMARALIAKSFSSDFKVSKDPSSVEIECTPDVASPINCSESGSESDDLESPITETNNRLEKLVCSHCKMSFLEKDELLEHMQSMHLSQAGNLSTPKTKVTGKQQLKYCINIADDGRFVCKNCNKTFEKRINCIKHIRSVHLSERKYICQHCQHGFFRGKDLRKHVTSRHHSLDDNCEDCEAEIKPVLKVEGIKSQISDYLVQRGDGNFSCNQCEKTFNKRINSIMHIRAVHFGEKKQINQSQKELLNSIEQTLLFPKKIKQPQEPKPKPTYSCPLCPEIFPFKGLADAHIKAHSTVCMHCNEELGHIDILTRHIQNMHTNTEKIQYDKSFLTELFPREFKRKEKQFQCTECNHKFSKEAGLSYHMESAHRSYICEVCSATLANKDSYRKHMKCSHGPKKYHCEKCFKSFARKDHLNNHVRGCKGEVALTN